MMWVDLWASPHLTTNTNTKVQLHGKGIALEPRAFAEEARYRRTSTDTANNADNAKWAPAGQNQVLSQLGGGLRNPERNKTEHDMHNDAASTPPKP